MRGFYDVIEISGRLSVRYEQQGKPETLHGSFTWRHSAQRTLMTLFSPLGQTLATIEITPTTATLTQANQPPRMATDVDALAMDTLGWPLPLSGLRQWLQGFATLADGRRFAAMPPATPAIMTRDGWRVHYLSWQDDIRPPHPKRIDLARTTAQAGDVSIRIVIDTWQTP